MESVESVWLQYKYNYDSAYEAFCYQNCIKQVLEAKGISGANYAINHSMTCEAVLREKDIIDFHYSEYAYDVLSTFKDKIHRQDDLRESKEVLEDNLREINNGNAIIVSADIYFLPYLTFYKKKHGRHNVILAGNKDKDTVYVIDWMAPWYYKGEISKKELFLARNSNNEFDGGIFSGIEIKNNWTLIEDWEWEIDKVILSKELFRLSYDEYYTGFVDGNKIVGIKVLYYIQDYFINLKKINDLKILKGSFSNLYECIFLLVKRKQFLLYQVKEIYNDEVLKGLCDCKIMKQYICSIEQVLKKWKRFLGLLLKESIKPKWENKSILLMQLKDLIEEEETEKIVLEKIISNL